VPSEVSRKLRDAEVAVQVGSTRRSAAKAHESVGRKEDDREASVLGKVVAEQMKAIEDEMDGGKVEVVCSVVGVVGPNGEQSVRFRATCSGDPVAASRCCLAGPAAQIALGGTGQE